jgi:hypothetical protein
MTLKKNTIVFLAASHDINYIIHGNVEIFKPKKKKTKKTTPLKKLVEKIK